MKIPKSVQIGGHKIDVCFAEIENLGEYHSEFKRIKLNASLVGNDKVLFETLRHEMIHCAFDISGIGFCETFEEEAIVRCMDNVFFPAYEKLVSTINKWSRKASE